MTDVRVFGLNTNMVFIEDISVDVVHGATVVIPADKAAKSKDLWRLISQKQLFRLNPGPMADYPSVAPPLSPSVEDRLREENRLLAEQNLVLRQSLTAQGGKLDAIIGLLESGRLTAIPQSIAEAAIHHGVVDNGIPTYIPSEIKPQNVESHIEVKSETSEGSGVAGASDALRKLRRGS